MPRRKTTLHYSFHIIEAMSGNYHIPKTIFQKLFGFGILDIEMRFCGFRPIFHWSSWLNDKSPIADDVFLGINIVESITSNVTNAQFRTYL